jgi:hypothetical protein
MVIIRILFFIFFLFLTVNSEKTLHQFELNVNFPSIQLDKKFPSSSYERVEKALNGTIDILKNILLINSSGVITTQINKTELCDDVDLKYINDDIEFQNGIETDFILIPLFDEKQEEFITHKICLRTNKSKRPLLGYLKLNEVFDFNLNINELTSVFLHHILHLIGFNEEDIKNNNDIFLSDNNISFKDSLLLNQLIFKKNEKEIEIEKSDKEIHFSDNLNYDDIMRPKENYFLISPLTLSILNSFDYYYVIFPYMYFDYFTSSYILTSYLIYENQLIEISTCYGDNFILNYKIGNKCNNSLREFETEITLGLFPNLQDIKEQTVNLLSPSQYCKNPQKTLFFKYPKIVEIKQDFKRVSKVTFTLKEYMFVGLLSFPPYINTAPLVLLNAFSTSNMKRIYNKDNGNLLWFNLEYARSHPFKLNYYERYNHFFNTFDVTRKDFLYINYKKLQRKFPKDFNYMAETYSNVFDTYVIKKFKDYKLSKDNLWMIKPPGNARGNGIRLFLNYSDLEKEENDVTLSKYISNPHLIYGKKYDLRIYILITGHSPLKIYIYNYGVVRRASNKYNLDFDNLNNSYIHLTNVAINEHNSKINIKEDNKEDSGIWDFDQYKEYLKKEGKDFDYIFKQIKDIAIKSLISVNKNQINAKEDKKQYKLNSQNVFELTGIDILIDENMKAWLLEFNLSPSLKIVGNYENKLKHKLIIDIFNIVGFKPFSHFDYQPYENGINYENSIDEAVNESICEFTRPMGDFIRVFPRKDNIDYYKQFFEEPTQENLVLWEELKKLDI